MLQGGDEGGESCDSSANRELSGSDCDCEDGYYEDSGTCAGKGQDKFHAVGWG